VIAVQPTLTSHLCDLVSEVEAVTGLQHGCFAIRGDTSPQEVNGAPHLVGMCAVNQVQTLATLLDVLVKLRAACSQQGVVAAGYSTDVSVFTMLYPDSG